MKTLIIKYSYTGNNALLADHIAEKLDADVFNLIETRTRTNKNIVLDILFGWKPSLRAIPENVHKYELVVFFSPVWMFHLPSPLCTCMSSIKKYIGKYAFISLSGGALGPNTKISRELKKRMGKNLALCLDLNTIHYCSKEQSRKLSDTSNYLLEDHPEDLEKLKNLVTSALRGINTC